MRKSFFPRILVVFACLVAGQAFAETKKVLKFWNLTSDTITELYAQEIGKTKWSPNLCMADPDHTVDPDERLSLPGFVAGTYNVRLLDKSGRACLLRNIVVRSEGPYAFSIAEEQMKSCASPYRKPDAAKQQ
jgi:hypothetical protein